MRSNHPWLYMQLLVNAVCCIYGRQEKLLFSTANTVKKLDLVTGVVKELANQSAIAYSIAYDVKGGYVYIPRHDENVIVRFPYPDDQTVNFEIVVSTNLPLCVAFDSENSHLYWTEYTTFGKIMRCNSDGSDLITIANETSPIALTLDTHNRLMHFFVFAEYQIQVFWEIQFEATLNKYFQFLLLTTFIRWIYYSESTRSLHRMTFNGKEKQVVINLTARPIDIQVDFADKRVYWMEYETGDLKSALYNGSDIKTVVCTNVYYYAREIDIGGDYVFYTSYNKILKVHKSSEQIPAVLHTETIQIYGVLFYKQEEYSLITTT